MKIAALYNRAQPSLYLVEVLEPLGTVIVRRSSGLIPSPISLSMKKSEMRTMPKYLFQANYTSEGMQGLLKEGGTSRRQVFEEMAQEQGGSLESFYYAFGGADLYVTFDLPDTATAAAISLSIGAGGALDITTVQLITPEEIDAACGKKVSYRPPGA